MYCWSRSATGIPAWASFRCRPKGATQRGPDGARRHGGARRCCGECVFDGGHAHYWQHLGRGHGPRSHVRAHVEVWPARSRRAARRPAVIGAMRAKNLGPLNIYPQALLLINNICWIAFAVSIPDVMVFVPNVWGVICCTFYTLVCLDYAGDKVREPTRAQRIAGSTRLIGATATAQHQDHSSHGHFGPAPGRRRGSLWHHRCGHALAGARVHVQHCASLLLFIADDGAGSRHPHPQCGRVFDPHHHRELSQRRRVDAVRPRPPEPLHLRAKRRRYATRLFLPRHSAHRRRLQVRWWASSSCP